jgi:hypothetical protein
MIKMYRTIIISVILYGCEPLSCILREEHRLRAFENRMLRRIFVSNRKEVIGGQRKLHNEELHNLCSLPNIVRIMKSRWIRRVGLMACMREIRNVYEILAGKPGWKRPHGGAGCRWEGNIGLDLMEIVWEGVD